MEDGTIALEFLLDPAVLMFNALAPETTLPLFLKRYAEMKPLITVCSQRKMGCKQQRQNEYRLLKHFGAPVNTQIKSPKSVTK